MTAEPIHLAFASDDVAVEGLAVAVLTAVERTTRRVYVWIVQEGIDARTQRRLRDAWAHLEMLAGVTFIPQASLPLPMPGWWARQRWPLLSAARFQLPLLLPAEARRCIYLDIDIVVGADVGELYDVDLHGAPLGMVLNTGMTESVRTYITTLGVVPDEYCNAGVMLIDLEAWRRENAAHHLIEHGRAMRPDIWFFDQDMLNTYFRGRCCFLESRWNHRDAGVEAHGVIQHLAGRPKPWQTRAEDVMAPGLLGWHRALARSGFVAPRPRLHSRLRKRLRSRLAQWRRWALLAVR